MTPLALDAERLIKETRRALRKVPASARGSYHQMATRYAREASHLLRHGCDAAASERAFEARTMARHATANAVWA